MIDFSYLRNMLYGWALCSDWWVNVVVYLISQRTRNPCYYCALLLLSVELPPVTLFSQPEKRKYEGRKGFSGGAYPPPSDEATWRYQWL